MSEKTPITQQGSTHQNATHSNAVRSSTALCARPFSGELNATIMVGGDKSISHRAVMLAALAVGRSEIVGLSKGDDVAATIRIMRQLGVEIDQREQACIIDGVGVGGLVSPDDILDCGNSGTTARLLLGMLASHRLSAFITGDASLRRRPMHHVITPLIQMGASFIGEATHLPLALDGSSQICLTPIEFEMPTQSAQLKSAVILAALNIAGETVIIEKRTSRDHTERMFSAFGGALTIEPMGEGARIAVKGHQELTASKIDVPGDPSSAAFLAALAAVSEQADLTIKNVGINPHRIGFYKALQKMGAKISFVPSPEKNNINEPVADIKITGGNKLSGIEVDANEAVGMIDEYPILSIVAAHAEGTTHLRGLSQLRLKESDRLTTIAENLAANGVRTEIRGDDLTILGCGGRPPGGGRVATYHDHRIAIAFLILGATAQRAVTIDDGSMIKTSFPDFTDIMRNLDIVIEQQ